MARKETKTGGRAETAGIIPGDFALSVGRPPVVEPEGWSWTKLSDVARLETGHTPSRRHPEYWGGDVPWIGIKDATANHGGTLLKTNQYTNDLGIANSSARVLPKNTVCLSRTASVGYVVVMGKPMATSQDFVNWVCDPSKLDYRFLKYVLLAERRSFLRFSSGTTHQTIYFPEVKAFHVCLPPLDEQTQIAHILGTLDDKIELNRQINTTLESMAQALFKSWFVDFEPVIDNALAAGNDIPDALQAKAAKRKALGAKRKALTDGIQQQFPDRFVFTEEMGWVPEGWESTSLKTIVELAYGKSLPAKNRVEGDIPVYGSGGVAGAHNEALVQGPSIVVGRKGTVGSLYWVDGPFFPIDTVFYAVPQRQGIPLYWIYQALQQIDIQSMGADSAVPGVNRDTLYSSGIVVPDLMILEHYWTTLSGLVNKQQRTIEQNRSLAKLRDTLLPKLLSGELRIPEAEKQLAEAL